MKAVDDRNKMKDEISMKKINATILIRLILFLYF